jgi:hypothetical protein
MTLVGNAPPERPLGEMTANEMVSFVLGVNSTVPPGGSLRCGRAERATSLERHGFQKVKFTGKGEV